MINAMDDPYLFKRWNDLKTMVVRLLADAPAISGVDFNKLQLRLLREDFVEHENYIIVLFDKHIGYGME